ncbi:MAG: hypothetical protein KDC92_07510 [Bacteroidetes bacterium]|nr:hypothetical protein [Bacteroidota bacterium]
MPCRYKVVYNSSTNSYLFTTDSLAEYEVLFSEDNSLFDSTVLANANTFHIALNKLRAGIGGYDAEMQITFSAIIDHFFKDTERLLTYVFNDADGKELIRKRLFQMWEKKGKRSDIVKMDAEIITEDKTYHAGILFHNQNSIGRNEISRAFSEIIVELTEK